MKLSEKIRMLSEADSIELWKNQIRDLSTEQLFKMHKKILTNLKNYNDNSLSLDDREYYTLLNKLDYIESKLGITSKIGRELR